MFVKIHIEIHKLCTNFLYFSTHYRQGDGKNLKITDHLLYVFNLILFFSREKKNEQKYLEFLKEGVKRAQVYQ